MTDCKPIFNYPLYFVDDFGKAFGPHQMKVELMRGPIVCGVMATGKMEVYNGGLFYENRTHIDINHDISVVGWGSMNYGPQDHTYEYWVMRNSWGSFWGEFGYMRILMYSDNNAIEKSCTWATPGHIQTKKMPRGYKWEGDFDYELKVQKPVAGQKQVESEIEDVDASGSSADDAKIENLTPLQE